MPYETRQSKDVDYWLKAKKEALAKHANGEALTLEETAAAIWDPDKEAHPMTCMGVLKIEKRALAKLKAKLSEKNISGLDDLFEAKFREYGKPISSIYHNS